MHRAVYHELQLKLKTLAEQLSPSSSQPGALLVLGQQLMMFWAGQLEPLDGDTLSPIDYQRWRSLQTELYRGLRLLNTELIFLHGAKPGPAQAQKQEAVATRITQLNHYCQAIIQLGEPSSPAA